MFLLYQDLNRGPLVLYKQHLFLFYRKHQWLKLSSKTPFTFLPQTSLQDLGVNFKDACRRLWRVLVS